MTKAKPVRRRSPATKALEELRTLVGQTECVLNNVYSDDVVADYAMRVGGARHFVSEMRRVIEAAQRETK